MPSCLVVDDSRVIRKIARHILESLNVRVTEACDGLDALNQCQKTQYDVVLLDWNMPVMSGMEFLQQIPSIGAPRPKVIFCTTESGPGHIRAAMDAGADAYVTKPFDRDTLEGALQDVGII